MKSSSCSSQEQQGANGIEYLDGLYGYAVFLTRNRAEAEDLVQEAYLGAAQAVNGVRPENSLKELLFALLRNIWFNDSRKRRNSSQIDDADVEKIATDEKADSFVNPHRHYVGKAETEQIQIAIESLPAKLQEIIWLREYEDLSYREISAILECSIRTVVSRLGRARSKLKTLLEVFDRVERR